MIGLKDKIMIMYFVQIDLNQQILYFLLCPTIMSYPDPLITTNLYTCAYDRSFTTISKFRKGLECLYEKCISKDEEIIATCTTHI